MAVELATELDQQLEECKAALRGQAQTMLAMLADFEAQLQARLDAAEARIASFRETEAAGAAV